VTTDDQDRVRFPYPNAVKVRPSLAERMRFWDPPIGSDQIQLYGPDQPGKDVYFLVEGESDTMCLWQQLEAEGKLDTAGVYGLPGVNTWRDEFAAKFESAKTVWVILDNDDPYENPQAVQSVEAAWPGIRRSLGRKAIRVRLPKGVNDICEFFLAYDMAALRVVLRSTPRASWHFAPVDFTKPVPPKDWMLEDVFHYRDFNLTVGDPGMGKSWIAMGLAVALVEGHPKFMGRPLQHHGPVYYIDEENPEDVIRRRMSQLGLTEKGHDPDLLRYLSNQGLDFEEKFEQISEEVMNMEPVAVVIDSLSEITSVDENSKADIGIIMDRIKSLARTQGATVILIHHADKDKGRARGSGHIRAATDAEWWVGSSEHDDGLFRMVCRKHRQGVPRGTTHMFRIEDTWENDVLRTALRPQGGDGEEPF